MHVFVYLRARARVCVRACMKAIKCAEQFFSRRFLFFAVFCLIHSLLFVGVVGAFSSLSTSVFTIMTNARVYDKRNACTYFHFHANIFATSKYNIILLLLIAEIQTISI